MEYLHNHPRLKPRTLFATHYHELVGLADLLPLVSNYNVAVAEEGDKVIFLHQIVPGVGGPELRHPRGPAGGPAA